jgi:hypothetical protein
MSILSLIERCIAAPIFNNITKTAANINIKPPPLTEAIAQNKVTPLRNR